MEELRMYILVNSSVKMSNGKVIAQAGHGVSEMTEYMIKNNPLLWKSYTKQNHAKISKKCPAPLLEKLYNKYNDKSKAIYCVNVIDAGRTQVKPGTMTVIVFAPMKRVDTPDEIAALSLY